jgi:hypothetical protein
VILPPLVFPGNKLARLQVTPATITVFESVSRFGALRVIYMGDWQKTFAILPCDYAALLALAHLGRHDTRRIISIRVYLLKVAKASRPVLLSYPVLRIIKF